MKGIILSLLMLLVVVAVPGVRSDEAFVKLCGREFIRAVIYTCGGSRWRRLMNDQPQEGTGKIWQNDIEELLDSLHTSMRKRRDLNHLLTSACCRSGCSKKELSSLC
ncbi:insulin-like peptide INSL5 [Protopterus annectens]|uniref:insulin-like peptide INSL5 n=1 Tax=Protopterus annectens TaxID=7888 RepID=UPI001CF9599C|nr:insulin-like peptide INSL5 [Protopterus annectens]